MEPAFYSAESDGPVLPSVSPDREGSLVRVRVSPRSSKNELVALRSERIPVKLTALPVDGKANRALIGFFAEVLGVPRRDVQVVYGRHSRNKSLRVRGLRATEVTVRLERALVCRLKQPGC